MTYRVVFTARARIDAIKQFHFLADRSPAAAARWYTGLEMKKVVSGGPSGAHAVPEAVAGLPDTISLN